MIKVVVGIIITSSCLVAYPQSVRFLEMTYDFGEVEEAGGSVTHSFTFVNPIGDSLKISGVRTSCGCTTPAWSKEYIHPGDSGFIVASFNPHNRPGVFRKSLRVTLSDGSNTTLFIEGTVTPRPRDVRDELPAKMGNLRFRYKSMNMGRFKTSGPFERSFQVYNEGQDSIKLLVEGSEFPSHIAVRVEPEVLQPRERGKIFITYDPEEFEELGFTRSPVTIMTTDGDQPAKDLQVLATVEEYFPPLTDEEIANAPQLLFDKREHDFGVVREATVEADLELKNGGKTSLNIRSIKSNCTCIETELDAMDISPGSSQRMKVRFLPEDRRGRQYKTVTIFSNDPVAPTQVISIKANVSR